MRLKVDWWDVALAVIVMAVVGLCYACLADFAQAGGYRQQVLAQQYAPVYYQVGQQLQQEATATYQFRQSDEYIELQQLRGYKAGVEAVTASGDRPSSPPQPVSGHPAATEEGQTTPPASDFAARYPTLAAKCQKCHSGDTPKGDVFIDGSVPLDGPDAASKRDAIARAIVNERMPDGKPLEDQEQFNALVELFTEPAE